MDSKNKRDAVEILQFVLEQTKKINLKMEEIIAMLEHSCEVNNKIIAQFEHKKRPQSRGWLRLNRHLLIIRNYLYYNI